MAKANNSKMKITSGSTKSEAWEIVFGCSYLDATQDDNSGKRAEWRWIDDCMVRFQEFDGEWVEDDLWFSADCIDTFEKLVSWLEHIGEKSRSSKRELISMVKCWYDRFSR